VTILYFDCFTGIAGDMSVAALLSLTGAEKELRKALKGVPLSGYRLAVTRAASAGIAGTRVDVKVTAFGIAGMCAWTYRWYQEGGRLSAREVGELYADLTLHGLISERPNTLIESDRT